MDSESRWRDRIHSVAVRNRCPAETDMVREAAFHLTRSQNLFHDIFVFRSNVKASDRKEVPLPTHSVLGWLPCFPGGGEEWPLAGLLRAAKGLQARRLDKSAAGMQLDCADAVLSPLETTVIGLFRRSRRGWTRGGWIVCAAGPTTGGCL